MAARRRQLTEQRSTMAARKGGWTIRLTFVQLRQRVGPCSIFLAASSGQSQAEVFISRRAITRTDGRTAATGACPLPERFCWTAPISREFAFARR